MQKSLTSFNLCCSQLHRNVPKRQENKCSRMVIRKYSLNSKAEGNFNKTNQKTNKLLNDYTILVFFLF